MPTARTQLFLAPGQAPSAEVGIGSAEFGSREAAEIVGNKVGRNGTARAEVTNLRPDGKQKNQQNQRRGWDSNPREP
jgi:hypothetical protein